MSESSGIRATAGSRPLPLRMRPDLIVHRHTYQGRGYRVIKDPLTLRFYRFEEAEYRVLESLDGRRSLDDVLAAVSSVDPTRRITRQEIHRLIGSLHRGNLVVSETFGQGRNLLRRHEENSRRERRSRWTNPLCVRLKGFDPDRLLSGIERRVGWLFSPPMILAGLFAAAVALTLVVVQFDVFRARLPAFEQFFAARNWIWIALTLAGTKILHELGHGLACKRQGGECHELGVMFLVLTPCLYCDVTDSWAQPDKWKRAAVGAAGMYVEILLASLCTFLWWFSQPGALHYWCLNVMFVSSVSTLLFNANPLMRFDGYYILSDLTEMPNLRQKSEAVLRRWLAAWVLGLRVPGDPFLPRRHRLFFALYTIASAAYRWVISLSILWFLYHVFEPYGLQVVGQAIAAVSLYCLAFRPIAQLIRFLGVPGRLRQVKKTRAIAWTAGTVALSAAALSIPWPHHVVCGVRVEARDAASVYVESAGSLTRVMARPGQRVRAGQSLAQLRDPDVDFEIDRLCGRRRQLQARLVNLNHEALRREGDGSASAEINTIGETLAAVERQLDQRLREFERLTIKAPIDGTVMAADPRPRPDEPAELPSWSGHPLQERNVGALLDEGELVCRVGIPEKLHAVLHVDQHDVERVRAGQPVEIQLRHRPSRVLRGRIDHVAEIDMKIAPRGHSEKEGGGLRTVTGADGRERPVSTTYEAGVPLDVSASDALIGVRGTARVRVGELNAARRIARYLRRTFNM